MMFKEDSDALYKALDGHFDDENDAKVIDKVVFDRGILPLILLPFFKPDVKLVEESTKSLTNVWLNYCGNLSTPLKIVDKDNVVVATTPPLVASIDFMNGGKLTKIMDEYKVNIEAYGGVIAGNILDTNLNTVDGIKEDDILHQWSLFLKSYLGSKIPNKDKVISKSEKLINKTTVDEIDIDDDMDFV